MGQGLAPPSLVVLLTRDEHMKGRWLVALEKALIAQGGNVLLLPLSSFTRVESHWRCLVNRVSDAAPPIDVKRTLAALRLAELQGVRTLNGISSFTVGTSKLLHHELFDCVAVHSPRSVQITRGMTSVEIQETALAAGLTYPLLLKPNSGGFGAGISVVHSNAHLTNELLESALGGDGLALLQQIASPVDGLIYRVFFLEGHVQCATKMKATDLDGFNACVCSAAFESWECPPDVAKSVGAMASKAQAHCGSVELMYVAEGKNEPRPLYFDFNLLSTMPNEMCYNQLAEYILR